MHRVPCPRCGILRLMSAREWNTVIACTQPRCGHEFRAPPVPTHLSALVTPPQAPGHPHQRQTLLTSPHFCFSCGGELHQPTGWRRGGLSHRRPADHPQPVCVTAAYAEIFNCPGCGALLETPSRACGQRTKCPSCARELRAPVFHMLHEIAGDHIEGEVFRFNCPVCRGRLQCDTLRGGRPTAGEPVACLHCSALIEVPAVGDSVRPRA
jgi:hypothetical protein